jgi:hypothetical protein
LKNFFCLENSRQSEQRIFLSQRRLRIGSFKNNSQWNGILAGLSFNRQSIFDSLSNTLIHSGDVEEVYPDKHTGLFNLVDSFYIATAIISSTSTSIIPIRNHTFEISTINLTILTTDIPIVDNIYHQEYVNDIDLIPKTSHQTPLEWFYKKLSHFGIRGLIIGSILSICLLIFLLLLILHLHCRNRHTKKKISYKHHQTNGNKKIYTQIKSSSSLNHQTKKHLPKFLHYLHKKQSKPSSFRLKSNGSITRLNSSDSYHLISSIQENHKDKRNSSYKNNSDCILDEHSSIHTSLSQQIPSPSIYHQVNRLMISGSEPPLPLSNLTQIHPSSPSATATLRSIKKDLDNSSAQAYSAVYSCELAANLDIDQEFFPQHRSSMKRRSTLKPKNQILFLYIKNLIDCYAIQTNNHQINLLAIADENRIRLFHVRVGYVFFLYSTDVL